MKKQEILNQLSTFPYERDAYWIITGGAMVLYGIRDQTEDIDLGCSKEMADLLEADGYFYKHTTDGKRWFKYGENIEIFETWLCDQTTIIDGFHVISLKGLMEMKQGLGREKDRKDIELIKQKIDIDEIQKRKDLYRVNQYEIDERFVIRDGKKHKCAIICPGGGYSKVCSYVEGTPFARKLNEKGISAIIVYYRVREKATFPNPQDDLARAVQEVFERKDELNLDMDGYSVWGSSAGGHLAGTFGTTAMGYAKYNLPKPGSIVLIYPVISLEKEITHEGTRNNLIGEDASRDDEWKHSVHSNVDANYPPTFIWCGDSDMSVPLVNTELMRKALESHGIYHVCKIYEGVGHGVGLATGTTAEGWVDEAIAFMKY